MASRGRSGRKQSANLWNRQGSSGRRGRPLARTLRIEPLEPRHLLAVFTVSNLESSGSGSLHEAVYLANESPGHDTIEFAPNVSGTIYRTFGYVVEDSVDIVGPGADSLTLDGHYSVFRISNPSQDCDVLISGLRITGAVNNSYTGSRGIAIDNRESLELVSCVIEGNSARDYGGAIYSEGGNVTLTDSFLIDNYAQEGGAIWMIDGDLTIASSVISGNTAKYGGAGIYMYFGNLRVTDSAIVSNQISGSGSAGGIRAIGANVDIERSLISGNRSTGTGGLSCSKCPEVRVIDSDISDNLGDGIGVFRGNLTVVNSLITGNRDAFEGAYNGGGIVIQGGNLTILSSTISNNIAGFVGGAITASSYYADPDPITIKIAHSTITGNESKVHQNSGGFGGGVLVGYDANLILDHTIVAGNIDHNGVSSDVGNYLDEDRQIISRYSIIGDNTGSGLAEAPLGMPDANGNLIGDPNGAGAINPLLGPLADNGGWTETHALLPGSPALNAGDPAFDPADPDGDPLTDDAVPFDQRGIPFDRVSGGRIDIGAFEAQVALPALLGDYNHNGVVDSADYTMWRDSLGDEVDFYTEADGSGNGVIDEDDFYVWRAHFGESLAEGGGAAAAATRLTNIVPRHGNLPAVSLAQRERLRAFFQSPAADNDLRSTDASAGQAPPEFIPLLSPTHGIASHMRLLEIHEPVSFDPTLIDQLLIDRSFEHSDIWHHEDIANQLFADDFAIESTSDLLEDALLVAWDNPGDDDF